MNLVRTNGSSNYPLGLFNQLHQDLENMFKNIPADVQSSAWAPSADIREEADHFLIEVDVPGVEPKDIDISMEKGVLTIRGERHYGNEDSEKNYRRVERAYGTFQRRFSLPEIADEEGITASGKNGVLEVKIPKKPVAQPRKITVQ